MNIFKGFISIIDAIPVFYEFTEGFEEYLLIPVSKRNPNTSNKFLFKLQNLIEVNDKFIDQLQGLAGFINALDLLTQKGLRAELQSLLFIDKPSGNYLKTGTGFWFHRRPIKTQVQRDQTTINLERTLTILSVYRTLLIKGNKYVDSLMLNESISNELCNLFIQHYEEKLSTFDDNIINNDSFNPKIKPFYKTRITSEDKFTVKPLMCYFNKNDSSELYIEKIRNKHLLTDLAATTLHDIMNSASKAQKQLFWDDLEPVLTVVSIKKDDKVLLGIEHSNKERGVIYELTKAEEGMASSEIYKITLNILEQTTEMQGCIDLGSTLMSKLNETLVRQSRTIPARKRKKFFHTRPY